MCIHNCCLVARVFHLGQQTSLRRNNEQRNTQQHRHPRRNGRRKKGPKENTSPAATIPKLLASLYLGVLDAEADRDTLGLKAHSGLEQSLVDGSCAVAHREHNPAPCRERERVGGCFRRGRRQEITRV